MADFGFYFYKWENTQKAIDVVIKKQATSKKAMKVYREKMKKSKQHKEEMEEKKKTVMDNAMDNEMNNDIDNVNHISD